MAIVDFAYERTKRSHRAADRRGNSEWVGKNNDNPGSPTPPQCRTFASEFTRQVVKPDFTTP